ncbi:aldehyde reductase [Rhizodiscina lignyota]|uniref:Aldehyde reductase n=1 Tax=Rhizodiscina lignyota TaxID=1504668 RepID=A0A9P4I995_9PEZI|nr:aldehyde reductase [Rhizodiscina lignyota]
MGGGGAFLKDTSTEIVQERFKILQEYGVGTIDTAQLYGKSEEILGRENAASRFAIDTKWPGGWTPGSLEAGAMVESAKESLQKLNTKQIEVMYFHAPDASVPLDASLKVVNQLYQEGVFKRFGVSNHTPEEVREVYDHCKQHGYVLPSVYQGTYSAIARHIETDLLPMLREFNMSFYGYSPLGGGFLTKTKDQVLQGAGRFNTAIGLSELYSGLYMKPSMIAALEKWENIAENEGCSKAELANRWVACSSALKNEFGDGIIIGSTSPAQLRETLEQIKKGPLSEKSVQLIDEMWKSVEHEAPKDNFDLNRGRSIMLVHV